MRIDAYGPNPSLAGGAFTDHIDIYVSPDRPLPTSPGSSLMRWGTSSTTDTTTRLAVLEYLSLRGVGGLSADYQSWTGADRVRPERCSIWKTTQTFRYHLMGNPELDLEPCPRTSGLEAQTFERFLLAVDPPGVSAARQPSLSMSDCSSSIGREPTARSSPAFVPACARRSMSSA